MTWSAWDNPTDWPFCPCGVTLMDPDVTDGLCGTCARQPHPGRDSDGIPSCDCAKCEAYWARIVEESRRAVEEHDRRRAEADALKGEQKP